MATTKTLSWGSDNPGNIELSADNWTGNQDVFVTSDENVGPTRTRKIVFYSKNNGNIVSPPVNVSQENATASAAWNTNNQDYVELNTSGGSISFDVITNVSSKDYIKIQTTAMPDGYSLSDGVAISGGWRYTLTYGKAVDGVTGVSITITVGLLDPIRLDADQPSKEIIDTTYTRWSTRGAYAGFVPVSGFYNNSYIGAGGASWGCYLSNKGTPTRTRTDKYNTGDVVDTKEYMPAATVIKGKVVHSSSSSIGRVISAANRQTTFGKLVSALPTVAGDTLFVAASLGTKYFDPSGNTYSGVAYELQVVDTELGEQYTIWSSIRDIPEQANKVVSYSTANASGTWGSIMTSGAGRTRFPSLGVQNYLWQVTAMFTGTFTSGAQGKVNAPLVRIVPETQSVPSGYEFILNTESDYIPEDVAATPTPQNINITCSGCGSPSSFLQCSASTGSSAKCRVEFLDHAGVVFHTIPSSRYTIATEMYPAEVVVSYIHVKVGGLIPVEYTGGVNSPHIRNYINTPNGAGAPYGPSSYQWYDTPRTYWGTGDDTEGGRLATSNNFNGQSIGCIPSTIRGSKAYGWLMRLTEGAQIGIGRTSILTNYLLVKMNINTSNASWCIAVPTPTQPVNLFPIDPNTGKVYAWITSQLLKTTDGSGRISRCSIRIQPTDTYSAPVIPTV